MRRIFLVSALLSVSASAFAQNPTIQTFGMVGIGEGQTLRLNVVAFPPDPCNGQIHFLDANGLPQPTPDKTVSLQPGEAASVSLRWAALGLPAVQRAELQPIVSVTSGACRATVEIFNTSTGMTTVAAPQPIPDRVNVNAQFGMVGITLGQIVRLNVVNYPPDPCSATIGFLGSNGTPVPLGDKTVNLIAGQADFIDLSAALLNLQVAQRAELQPVVTLIPGAGGTSNCQATVEIISAATGKTQAVLTPQPIPN